MHAPSGCDGKSGLILGHIWVVIYFGNSHLCASLPQTQPCGGSAGHDVPADRLLRLTLQWHPGARISGQMVGHKNCNIVLSEIPQAVMAKVASFSGISGLLTILAILISARPFLKVNLVVEARSASPAISGRLQVI